MPAHPPKGFNLLHWSPGGDLAGWESLTLEQAQSAFGVLRARFEAGLLAAQASARTLPLYAHSVLAEEKGSKRKVSKKQVEQLRIHWDLFAELERQHRQLSAIGALLSVLEAFDARFTALKKEWTQQCAQLVDLALRSRLWLRLVRFLEQHPQLKKGQKERVTRSGLRAWSDSEVFGPRRHRTQRMQEERREKELLERYEYNICRSMRERVVFWPQSKGEPKLPPQFLEAARELALNNQRSGWQFDVSDRSYHAIMGHCGTRSLRRLMYRARASLASEQCCAGSDNRKIMGEILSLRERAAKRAGHASYAEQQLAQQTLKTPQATEDFLCQMSEASKPIAKREKAAALRWLRRHESAPVACIQPWDWRYIWQGMSLDLAGAAQHQSRACFPVLATLEAVGIFVAQFLGLRSERRVDLEQAWGIPLLLEWREPGGKLRSRVWIDPWESTKKPMNWPFQMTVVEPVSGEVGLCAINLNQERGIAGMTHGELVVALHEFGHVAHAVGARGRGQEKSSAYVEADAIEFYSQFFERFAWEEHVLSELARMAKGKPFRSSQLKRLLAAKSCGWASEMAAGIAESLCDLRMHGVSAKRRRHPEAVFNWAREDAGLSPAKPYRRFWNSSFSMRLGYSCLDYSYLWTATLAAQTFEQWEKDAGQHGPLAAQERFVNTYLRPGSSQEFLKLHTRYCARPASTQEFLRLNGLEPRAETTSSETSQ